MSLDIEAENGSELLESSWKTFHPALKKELKYTSVDITLNCIMFYWDFM